MDRSYSQLTIHGMPKRSVHIPKPDAQNVFANGIVVVPPSANALKICSPLSRSLSEMETEKPCGFAYCGGGASDPINLTSSTIMLACSTLSPHSGGACSAAGEPLKVMMASILPPSVCS